MGNLGGSEILVILLVALIILGPDKLPDAARQAGKLMNQFRRISTDFRAEFESAILQPDDDPSALPGSEPYRDRDDVKTLEIEAAARAKGDALVADADSTSNDDGGDGDDDDAPPKPNPASMAYRPEQSSYLAIDPSRASTNDTSTDKNKTDAAATSDGNRQPDSAEPAEPADQGETADRGETTIDTPGSEPSEDTQP